MSAVVWARRPVLRRVWPSIRREREREREASRRLIYLSARSNQPNEIDLKVYS